MTISTELVAKIRRYYYVEKWRIGTISRQLGVHHSAVERVLSDTGVPHKCLVKKPSIIDSYLPFIHDTLEKYPKLAASRLYIMACERGYRGGPSYFRHIISMHRPRPIAEAYLRLRTLPGEQAQVDWGHFGHLMIGRAKRPLMAFVMVLSYSRKVFLRFYLNQRLANFLHGHVSAFDAFGGSPRVCLYDNLRSAVLERQGDAIRFHPTLLEFSAHYRFEPRPVAVARGNEKGRVERAIRYIRDSFFAAREFDSLDDLNQQAQQWCEGVAAERPCPEDRSKTVQCAFIEEQPRLLSLPDDAYTVDEQTTVHVGKTPYVRFDWNDYSVPHQYVRRSLMVRATQKTVRIIDADTLVATHPRSYDKAQQIEQASHIQSLVDTKKAARVHRAQDRLTQTVPNGSALLKQAAKRGYHIASITRALLRLLDDYGASELEAAIEEALSKAVPHPNAVRISLQRRREAQHQPPITRLALPDDKRIRDQVVRVHDLNTYDQLQKTGEEHE